MKFKESIKINGCVINADSPVFIIAEAGVNHCGDMNLAKELVDAASEAGADAVKFQAFKTEYLILQNVKKAPYQQESSAPDKSQFDMLKELEITKEQAEELKRYCAKRGCVFLTTPFDEASLDELDSLNLPVYKIASTDITNLPFLRRIAKKGKPLFLSTGMAYLSEVEMALQEVFPYNKEVILLQCTANYPIRNNEANLNVLNTFKSKFQMLLGYSDHTLGTGAGPYAVTMGAKVIEKHFTLDKTMDGPDHRASLDTDELRKFVNEIRKVEEYLGRETKLPMLSEQETRKSLQKCLVASKEIKKGEILSADNIVAKRTGGEGISPIYYQNIFDHKATQDYKKDDIIKNG